MLNIVGTMYRTSKQVHHELFSDLQGLEAKFQVGNLAERVDIVYGLQKTSEMLSELRKQIDKIVKKLGTQTCMQMELSGIDKVKTGYCTATTKLEYFANLPHKREKDPVKFDAIMVAIGIPAEVVKQEGVRFHWPGFKEYLTNQVAAGFPVPEGIKPDDMYTEYTLSTRKLKEPDED